jgi:tetratricopeptide (TPR) repeat protein
MSMQKLRTWIPVALCGLAAVVVFVRTRPVSAHRAAVPLAAGTPGGVPTSRDGLASTIAALERRLADEPANAKAATRLAEALVRQARATSNGGLAVRAEAALRTALEAGPSYEAQRMLGTVLASEHRFREAIAAAEQARKMEPNDAWNEGIIGDAHLELGEYDAAFDAFDRMVHRRPTAAAYARAAYARELQGDLPGALHLMQMAADATTAHDPESQAWHYAQLGDLYFQMGHLADAEREFGRADFTFPGHPHAIAGLARVDAARGDLASALARYTSLEATGALPEHLARMAEIEQALGRSDSARRHYALA